MKRKDEQRQQPQRERYVYPDVSEAVDRWNRGIPALLAENLRKVIARERRKDKPEPEDDSQ
jgi:hypothetical protein